jgi:hypothetical protein
LYSPASTIAAPDICLHCLISVLDEIPHCFLFDVN